MGQVVKVVAAMLECSAFIHIKFVAWVVTPTIDTLLSIKSKVRQSTIARISFPPCHLPWQHLGYSNLDLVYVC